MREIEEGKSFELQMIGENAKTLFHTPEYGKFDIRQCPIWAIPQLAELKRRLSNITHEKINQRKVTFMSFQVVEGVQGPHYGRFVVDIPGDDVYYGYLHGDQMNDYKHPWLMPILTNPDYQHDTSDAL